MDKDTFLKDISSMSRKEINRYFEKKHVRTKKITPLIILGKEENKGDDMNGRKKQCQSGATEN